MKIGFAKSIITPEFPVLLSGFAVNRKSFGKLDDLYVKVIIYEHNGKNYGVITFDLVAIDSLIIDRVNSILKEQKLDEDNFVCIATHTHSGPCGIVNTDNGVLKPVKEVFGETNFELIEFIVEQTKVAIHDAIQGLKESVIRYRKDVLSDIGNNRNSRELKGNDEIVSLSIEQVKGKKIMLTFFSCHPTVLNSENLMVSADYPGAINTMLEAEGYLMNIFFNGSCGDISTRFSRKESSAQELNRYAKMFVNKMKEMNKSSEKFEIEDIKYVHKNISLKTKKIMSEKEAKIKLDECTNKYNMAKLTQISSSELRVIESLMEGAQANLRLAKNAYNFAEMNIHITLVKINNKIIVFVPGELFSELSNDIQNDDTIFVGYANGYVGYFANLDAYNNSCYEALSSPFEKGESEKMIDFIKEEIRTLKEEI
ncbi:MAG: neutral/alkaline non-lysosomal ceramidase N-terminal domain-containing protein [Longicatena sp.]